MTLFYFQLEKGKITPIFDTGNDFMYFGNDLSILVCVNSASFA